MIPSRDNLEKVRKTPCPTIKKQVRCFIGLVGYYRDHILAFPEILAPLTDLLKKGKSNQVKWSGAQERAYSLIVEGIPAARASVEPLLSDKTVLPEDRHIWGWGGGMRESCAQWATPARAKYPSWSIRRFKQYLAGKLFTLQTDHKYLKYLNDADYQNDHL